MTLQPSFWPPASALLWAAAAAGALAGCGPEPPVADLRLLPLPGLSTAPATPGGKADGAGPFSERVRVAESERVAVRTEAGRPVRLALPPGSGGARLELAAAVTAGGRAGGEPVTITIDRAGGDPTGGLGALLREELHPADGWVRFELDLGDGGPAAALDLASDGPAAWAGLWLVPGTEAAAAAPASPNVILISLDTVRADHLSLYGYRRPTSPNLDRFAADAWVFEQAYSASTWTPPSHASMFTGLLPDQHGVRRAGETLAPEAVTAAELLRAAGYRTAAITDGGFVDSRWGLGQGFDRYDVTPGQAWQPKDAAVIFDRAAQWVEENRQRPFFLFVHTYEAHQPYDNRGGFGDPFLEPDYSGRFAERADVTSDAIDAAELPQVIALYDGGLRRTDHFLGRFLRTLGRRGLLETTAVIVTSDHGEELQEHGGLEHMAGKVFEENVRVPLVVRPPGGLPAGAEPRPRTPVGGLDLLPTLIDLAGLDPDGLRPLAGASLLDLAAAPFDPDRTLVVQGLNSLPELHERRFRLDRGSRTLIFDQVRGTAERYQRDRDPGMIEPLPAIGPDGDGAGLAARLQTLLAWLQPGVVAVRLPPAAAGLRVPAGSGLTPRGVWSGLEWRPAGAGSDLALEPGRSALAVFEVTGGPAGRRLEVAGADGRRVELRLEGPVDSAAGPPGDGLPPPGLLFRGAPRLDGGRAEIDAEQAAELRALGYL